MGIQRQNGYSATVAAYLRVGSATFSVAKVGRQWLTLVEPVQLPPGTEGQLVVIIDQSQSTRTVIMPQGAVPGERQVQYSVLAPF